MIITDRFVFVHFPKTGGTFVEEVLEKIHRARGDRIVEWQWRKPSRARVFFGQMGRMLGLKRVRAGTFIKLMHRRDGVYSHHGPVSRIPADQTHKPILSVLRNPYDWYVSQYEYKWWIQNPPPPGRIAQLKAAYPRYPELTFEEHIHFSNHFHRTMKTSRFPPEDRLGRLTVDFANFFFTHPERVADMDEACLRERRYRRDLSPRLKPIFQEDLNRQLHDFLLEMEYRPEEVAFILNEAPILPAGSTRAASQKWEHYYTPELKADIRRRERLLFTLYPQWDV